MFYLLEFNSWANSSHKVVVEKGTTSTRYVLYNLGHVVGTSTSSIGVAYPNSYVGLPGDLSDPSEYFPVVCHGIAACLKPRH